MQTSKACAKRPAAGAAKPNTTMRSGELRELTLKIATEESKENPAAFGLHTEHWVKSVTASLGEDGSLVVVTAVLDQASMPGGSSDTRAQATAEQPRGEIQSTKVCAKQPDASTVDLDVDIYTDDGCLGNPGPGGWAAVIYDGPKPREISGCERDTTNNRQELRAAVEGLKALGKPSRVRLFSDSAYVMDAFEKGWIYEWERNGWKNADKKPVKNCALWRELLALTRRHQVEFVKVAGHAFAGAWRR